MLTTSITLRVSVNSEEVVGGESWFFCRFHGWRIHAFITLELRQDALNKSFLVVIDIMSSSRGVEADNSPTSTMVGQEVPNVGELVEQMSQVIKLLQEQKVCLRFVLAYFIM